MTTQHLTFNTPIDASLVPEGDGGVQCGTSPCCGNLACVNTNLATCAAGEPCVCMVTVN